MASNFLNKLIEKSFVQALKNVPKKVGNALMGTPVEFEQPKANVTPQYPQAMQQFMNELPNQPYAQSLYNQPKQTQLTNEQINEQIANGINFGIPEIAQAQKEWGISIPKTGEEIYNAKIGQFNQYPATLQTGVANDARQGGFLRDFSSGMHENYSEGFNPDNWGQKKNWATRLGELGGTALRLFDTPVGRGLAAAGLAKMTGQGDPWENFAIATVGRQQNRLQDQLYRRQLEEQGIDTSGIRGNVDKDIYKSISDNIYKQQSLQVKQDIAAAKDNTQRAKLILDSLNNGTMTPQEAQLQIAQYGITANDLQKSNATRKTEVEEYLAPHKANFYDNSSAVAMGNLGLKQQELAINAPYIQAKTQKLLDDIYNPKPTADERKEQRQLQQASKTINTIKQAYQATLDNPKAFGYWQGVAGADITNRADTAGTKQRAIVESVAAEYRKYLTGAQMSDKEREAYYKFIPSPKDNAAIAQKKLEGMLTVIASREGVEIPDLTKLKVSGQVANNKNTQQFVKMKAPNGKIYNVPSSKVQEMKNKGGVVING